MPGHPIPTSSLTETQDNVKLLEELIASHDAVFLLMDSRESRWLPTVIASSLGKIVINAALGFDSYLVMRHGAAPSGVGPPTLGQPGSLKPQGHEGTSSKEEKREREGEEENDGKGRRKRLGCYYCNDVVAPADVSLSLFSLCSNGTWMLIRDIG